MVARVKDVALRDPAPGGVEERGPEVRVRPARRNGQLLRERESSVLTTYWSESTESS